MSSDRSKASYLIAIIYQKFINVNIKWTSDPLKFYILLFDPLYVVIQFCDLLPIHVKYYLVYAQR